MLHVRASISLAAVAVAAMAALACTPPSVTSGGDNGNNNGNGRDPERTPGGGNSGGSGGGNNGGGSGSGGPGLSLPDASATPPDLRPAEPETCSEQSHTPTRVPLVVFVLLDGSGSMAQLIGMKTKLAVVRDSIKTFLADPGSTGLGVGLSIFPGTLVCNADTDCPMLMTNGVASPGRCNGIDSGCVAPGSTTVMGTCIQGGPARCAAPAVCTKVGRCGTFFITSYCTLGSMCASGAPCAPIERTCSTSFCGGTAYQKPLVAFGDLPGSLMALNKALDAREPSGGTPLGDAIIGTLPMLKAHMTAHPDRRVVLLIASDGAPDASCGGQPAILQALRDARMATPSLSTYAIGVFGGTELASGRVLINDIATAGGTNTPYVIDQNLNLAEAFLKALSEIRGNAIPCEFMIPPGKDGAIDYDKVNLRWSSNGMDEVIGYVGSADRCDMQKGGWYYDMDPKMGGKPTRVVACPATCAKLKSDDKGKVDLRFGCKTRAID